MNQREYTFIKREEGQSFDQIAKFLKVESWIVEGWYIQDSKKYRQSNLTCKFRSEIEKMNKRREDNLIDIEIKEEEEETQRYHKLIWDTDHTEDWGVEHDCRYDDCDCKISRKVISHFEQHYAFLECSLCGRWQKWLKKP